MVFHYNDINVFLPRIYCIRTLPRGGMYWEIHPPRPERFPSALEIALGQSLGPRGAKSPPSGNLSGLGGCISQYIPPLGSVRIQYHPFLLLLLMHCCTSSQDNRHCLTSNVFGQIETCLDRHHGLGRQILQKLPHW